MLTFQFDHLTTKARVTLKDPSNPPCFVHGLTIEYREERTNKGSGPSCSKPD